MLFPLADTAELGRDVREIAAAERICVRRAFLSLPTHGRSVPEWAAGWGRSLKGLRERLGMLPRGPPLSGNFVMKSSPLAQVKDRFKDKDALVAAVKALATDELWLGRMNEDKGFGSVSNKKLLHLHDLLSDVKKNWGGRSGLVDSILKAENRAKDDGYRTRLQRQSTPRLVDLAKAAKKRSA